jgi:ComF family protein
MSWVLQQFKEYGSGLVHLLFPNVCEGCHQPLLKGEEVVCLQCESLIPFTNFHLFPENETAMRLAGRVPFQHTTSLTFFTNESLIQHLIHGLKYKNKKQIGIYLGKEIGKTIKASNWNLDGIVPVPLHPKKEAFRGYNQSDMIANGIHEALSIPVFNHHLKRIKNTATQTDKTRAERIENVSGAFAVSKKEEMQGKHLLLVDDVFTTGATLESCATTLLQIPDVKVSIATVAIAAN